MSGFDSGGEPTAAFNSARAYTEELSIIRRNLHEARHEENLTTIYNLLRSYFIALSPRMKTKKSEKDKNTQTMLEMNQEKYKKAKELYSQYKIAMLAKQVSIPREIYDHFDEWEILLRKNENELKLLMRDSDDPGLALS